jgi:hypothetical protein
MTGDNAQSRAVAPPHRLEWQSELDSALSDIDHRLTHPRRRASDTGPQPVLPELGQVDVTSELLDEIAWRAAEQLRRQSAATPAPPAIQTPPPALRPGKMVLIRYRVPALPWPLRLLQRRHPLTVRASA